MKKLSKLILTIVITSTALYTYSQDISDALRYSYKTPSGTARFMSMGGSFGALGGDFSSLSINPAGIGVYRSSEISFTPSLYNNQIESTYYGNTYDDFQYDFNIHNLSGVFYFPVSVDENTAGWRSLNFGIGVNRHNNFNFRRLTEGINPDGSILQDWREQAITDQAYIDDEGYLINFDRYTTELAHYASLLYDTADHVTRWEVDPASGGLYTTQESDIKGSIRELELSFGGNYNDRLYLGASFGFPRVQYEEITTHKEADHRDTIPFLNHFSYKYNLKTKGTGFNFKIGGIFRASDMIRIGASIHTPTFYDLSDEWSTTVKSDITFPEDDRDTFHEESPKGRFDYEINTPLKAIGSIGLIFGANGLINIDYEYIDYTNTRLRSNDYSFQNENNIIQSDLQAQHNIRAGGEIRFEPFAFRAGYAYYSNPYKSDINNTEQSIISVGFGMREQSYFLDFAYMISLQNEDYYPYSANYTNPIQNKYTRNAFTATLGLRF